MSIDLLKYQSSLKIVKSPKNAKIFCALRKKWLVLTPEEVVRQIFVEYLTKELHYSLSLISVERQHSFNDLQRRSDLLVYNKEGNVEILVECKRPEIKLSKETLEQASWYNKEINAKYIILTNGMETLFYNAKPFEQLDNIPKKN